MGQQKGNPIPSPQNQAYETLRPNLGARANRDMGTKPVMIDDMTTLNDVVDITFETDAVAAMVSASLNTTIGAVSSSINTTIGAVSSSINVTINSSSASLHDGSKNVTFNNVAATSNGLGQNFKVGDDAWIGDINASNTIVVSGIQNPTAATIQFGSGSQPSISHLIVGASFPAVGSSQAITGSLLLGHNGRLYFFNGQVANGGWAQVI
jgi:hypothetical protein